MTYRMRLYLNRMHRLDSNVCVAVNHTSQYRVIRDGFRLISRLGDGLFWYGLMLGMLLLEGSAAFVPVAHMVATGLIGTLLYKWVKGKTLRPRPYEVRQEIYLTGTPLDKFSFPSGHTLHAVVFSFIALSYYPQLAMILVPFTMLIALSRVVLGLHYPSDVFAGALLGAAVASLSFLIL
jgi:undecaprenyl-diphosphatase